MNNYTNRFQRNVLIGEASSTPLTQEGEDIRKAYLIMKDGVDLIGSCVSAILAYQKKETKESIIEELKKIRRTIDLVKEGTNKPHSSTLQSLSTLPSAAENKEFDKQAFKNLMDEWNKQSEEYVQLKSDFLLAVERITELKKEVEAAENTGWSKCLKSIQEQGL